MDANATYTKTGRGLRALVKKLPRDAGRVLSVMDKGLTAEEILSRLNNVNETKLEVAITWLLEGGFIKSTIIDPFSNTMWEGSSANAMQVDEIGIDEFTVSEKPPTNNTQQTKAVKKTPREIEAEEKEKAKIAAQKKKLEQADAEARERAEASLKAKTDAETQATANKNQAAAEVIAKAKQEAREKAEAEAKVAAEEKAKSEAETKARVEAEANLKKEAAAREKAEVKAAAEVKEKLEVEEKVKLKALAKADEEARKKAEAEVKAKAETETNLKKEETARKRAKVKEAAEAKEKLEAEEKVKLKALAKADEEARKKAEAEAKVKAKAEAKIKKEVEEKAAAEEKARLEAEEKARLEAEAKAEEEARKKAEVEAKAKAKAEAKAKKEAEEKAAAEEKERLAAEEKARLEAEAKAEEEAKAAAEEKARLEAEEKARLEAEVKAEEEARKKAEAKAKKQAEVKAKKEAKAKEKAAAKAEAKIAAEKKKLEKAAEKERARLDKITEKEEKTQKRTETKRRAKAKKQRLVESIRSKLPGKKWLISIAKSIKPLSIFALSVFFLLIIAAQFINMSILINPIEKIATENIQAKVNIKSINISLFPSPHLLLEDLTIADSTTINVKKMRVYPDLLSIKNKLFNSTNTPYEINSIKIEGFNIAQKDLPRISSWAGASSRHQQLKIKRITLKDMSINLNVVQLPYFDGDIMLDDAGLVHQASFVTEHNNLNIVINHVNNDYLIKIEAVRWRVPLSPKPVFTKLNATGTIKDNVLTLSSITGALYNGDLTAQLTMDFSSPNLTSIGEFSLTNFYIKDMAKELQLDTAVDGKLNFKGSYAFDINKPLNIIDMTGLNTEFSMQNGHLRKVDLAEAMRSGNLNGNTDFTSFSGKVSLKNKKYRFYNLLLKDKQLQATGHINVSPDQYVSGVISTSIALKRNSIRARLNIAGPLTALKLKN